LYVNEVLTVAASGESKSQGIWVRCSIYFGFWQE